jgi:hypothetical protein
MSFKEFISKKEHVRRYVEYRSIIDNIPLEEAARRSLGHMWSIANDPEKNVAIITAFRHENTGIGGDQSANFALNQQLLDDLRQMGYGSIPVAGGYKEDVLDNEGRPTGEKRKVEEDSFVVNGGNMDATKFREDMLELCRKYNQDAVLVKYSGGNEAYLLLKNGDEEKLGKWSPSKAAEYYTRMKKGPPDREFTFEAAGDLTRSTLMAMSAVLKGK